MSSNVRVAEVRYLVLSSGAVVRSGLVQLGAYTVRSLPLPLTPDMGQFYFCTVLLRIFARVTEPRCSPGVHAAGVARGGLQGHRPPGHLPGLPDTSSVGEDNIIVIIHGSVL